MAEFDRFRLRSMAGMLTTIDVPVPCTNRYIYRCNRNQEKRHLSAGTCVGGGQHHAADIYAYTVDDGHWSVVTCSDHPPPPLLPRSIQARAARYTPPPLDASMTLRLWKHAYAHLIELHQAS